MGNLGSGYMFFKVEAQRVREPGPDFHTIMSIKKMMDIILTEPEGNGQTV